MNKISVIFFVIQQFYRRFYHMINKKKYIDFDMEFFFLLVTKKELEDSIKIAFSDDIDTRDMYLSKLYKEGVDKIIR